jgi:hypothetical protein
MFIEPQIFEDIISIEEQNSLLEFMESDYKKWAYIPHVSLDINELPKSENQPSFPAYTADIYKKNSFVFKPILPILKKIESNICKKLNLTFLQNNRYKLNYQPPIPNYSIDELYKNIHCDSKAQHIVILYYANDSDGDTLIFKNKRGFDIMSNEITKEECKNGIFDNVELIHSISPKKGRAAIFDGALLHSASWSNTQNRYAVNFNVILDDNTKKINLI